MPEPDAYLDHPCHCGGPACQPLPEPTMPEPDTTPAAAPHVYAPFSSEQVTALNRWQHGGPGHPFTCARLHARGRSPVLDATHSGWICPDPDCDFTQDWALTVMANPGAWPTLGAFGRTETGATIADAHPSIHRWRVEHVDGNEWVPGSGLKTDRAEAVHLLNVGNEIRPLWADGTPVHRRLVRETTSYTVETALNPPADQDRGAQ